MPRPAPGAQQPSPSSVGTPGLYLLCPTSQSAWRPPPCFSSSQGHCLNSTLTRASCTSARTVTCPQRQRHVVWCPHILLGGVRLWTHLPGGQSDSRNRAARQPRPSPGGTDLGRDEPWHLLQKLPALPWRGEAPHLGTRRAAPSPEAPRNLVPLLLPSLSLALSCHLPLNIRLPQAEHGPSVIPCSRPGPRWSEEWQGQLARGVGS